MTEEQRKEITRLANNMAAASFAHSLSGGGNPELAAADRDASKALSDYIESLIPTYAHPIRIGIDGIRARRIEGPRTKASTERRAAYRTWAVAETARRAESFGPAIAFMPAEYLAVAR